MKPCIITPDKAGDLPQEHNATIFNFDLDKMKSAVNAPYHMLPKGLTYEEYTAWLKSKVSKPWQLSYTMLQLHHELG